MKLFTVTISGDKFYFLGDISPSIATKIDRYCLIINREIVSDNSVEIFVSLLKYICIDLGCDVEPLSIEHIFRINL